MNWKAFFSSWPEIIKAVQTPEGIIVLTILAVTAIAIVVVASRKGPWYAVPSLVVIMFLGLIALSSVIVVQHPLRPLSIDMDRCRGNATSNVDFTGRVWRNGFKGRLTAYLMYEDPAGSGTHTTAPNDLGDEQKPDVLEL